MKNRILAGLIVAVMMAGAAAAGPLEDGLAAYNRADYATALQLWRPLAEQGNAAAQFHLGIMYVQGHGVPQDYAEAVKWYRLAAEQGDYLAQWKLGLMYSLGRGVPIDQVLAHMWLNLAAVGEPLAAQDRDDVADLLTPEKIAEAQRLASQWKPKTQP